MIMTIGSNKHKIKFNRARERQPERGRERKEIEMKHREKIERGYEKNGKCIVG